MIPEPMSAIIQEVEPLTDSILKIIVEPEHYVDYSAGQYLKIMMPNETLAFSIANAPLGAHHYEIHVRHHANNPLHQSLLSFVKQSEKISISLPFGRCNSTALQADKPILFIAGGIGFAPIKAMIEQLLAYGTSHAFELFWAVRSQSDVYMENKVSYWQKHSQHFRYFSHLSQFSKLHLTKQIIERHVSKLHTWQIVISGPFDMAFDIRAQLITAGADPAYIFGDAFEEEKP